MTNFSWTTRKPRSRHLCARKKMSVMKLKLGAFGSRSSSPADAAAGTRQVSSAIFLQFTAVEGMRGLNL